MLTLLRMVFDQPDETEVHAQFGRVVEGLEVKFRAAAEHLDAARADLQEPDSRVLTPVPSTRRSRLLGGVISVSGEARRNLTVTAVTTATVIVGVVIINFGTPFVFLGGVLVVGGLFIPFIYHHFRDRRLHRKRAEAQAEWEAKAKRELDEQ